MSIHPIQGFKNLSTGKKVAVVAGTAAAVGATVYAGIKGKAVLGDEFVKSPKGILKAIGKGYGAIGSAIAGSRLGNAVQGAAGKVKKFVTKISAKMCELKNTVVAKLPKFQKAAEKAAQEAAEQVQA